jgi:hypothetical protein
LGAIADRYWPDLTAGNPQSSGQEINGKNDVPPLAFMEPNSRPLPDPQGNTLNLEVIEHLANGTLNPQDLNSKCSGSVSFESKSQEAASNRAVVTGVGTPSLSRITLDPLRMSGSNATTMVKSSQQQAKDNAATFSGFVQVSAETTQ